MHTRHILSAEHFTYRTGDGGAASFVDFCSDYSPQDRVAIVAPTFDEGVIHAGLATLALTTAFYDALRRRWGGAEFFDYPSHFCLVDRDDAGVLTPRGRIAGDVEPLHDAWSNLDVWPSSKWIAAGSTPADMLAATFDLQIERLLWPEGWGFSEGKRSAGRRLPEYANRMLRTRLRSVWCYASDRPTIRISGAEPVEEMVRRSVAQLPAWRSVVAPIGETYRAMGVTQFLDTFAGCFDPA